MRVGAALVKHKRGADLEVVQVSDGVLGTVPWVHMRVGAVRAEYKVLANKESDGVDLEAGPWAHMRVGAVPEKHKRLEAGL